MYKSIFSQSSIRTFLQYLHCQQNIILLFLSTSSLKFTKETNRIYEPEIHVLTRVTSLPIQMSSNNEKREQFEKERDLLISEITVVCFL